MSVCKWPDHALVIDPQGWLKPCCMVVLGDHHINSIIASDKTEYQISTSTEYKDFAYSDLNMHIRRELKEKGIEGTNACDQCASRIKQNGDPLSTHAAAFDWLNPEWRKYEPGKISYLEFTTSNICNQTCIMCSSYFSTKWSTIDHLFGTHQHQQISLTEADVEKIISLLPDLHVLHIKGGEPFSDLRNAKILEELAAVNPDCTVWLTSNCSLISKRFMNTLKKFKKVEMVASLDHIGRKYEWIRGTNFNNTLETIKKLNQEAGIVPKVVPTVSYFNILDMQEINDFYADNPHVYIGDNKLKSYNLLFNPPEMNYLNTRTQEELDTINQGVVSQFNQDMHNELYRKIEIMNGIRGFRWQDC